MENTTLFVMAMVAALALLGLFMAQTVLAPQMAEARGCKNSIAFNASQGRCFHP